MKKLIVIGSYPNTPKKEEVLKSEIQSLKDIGFDFMLVSHYPVSSEIQHMVDYYIYDKNQTLTPLDKTTYYWFKTDIFMLRVNNSRHALPICQNMFNAFKLAEIKEYDFVLFFNSRNIRRKQPSDVIESFKLFCDKLTKEQSDKCVLVMHTTPIDNNGTDLYAVRDKICPNYDVVFSTNKIESDVLNKLYNIADCTINIANNEGFGLGTAESIMAGTPIIVSVTGGLQDQCGFNYTADDYVNIKTLHNKQIHKDTPHGVWVKPIWPSAININGSPLTPYIYDDRVNDEEVADAINEMYLLGKEKRKENGQVGREWAINNLSSKVMCDAMSEGIQKTIKNFTPRERFNLYKVI